MNFLRKLSQLPDSLDWLLSVVEPLIVLGITFLMGYGVYWLVFGAETGGKPERLAQLMKEINDNWKAALILLVLLFYRTIRIFLEEAQEAFGVKRSKVAEGEPTERPNPPAHQQQ